MNREQRIKAFSELGNRIRKYIQGGNDPVIEKAVMQAEITNGWFIRSFTDHSLNAISEYLKEEKLREWLNNYPEPAGSKTVGVIMAGNIPAAGFFDALCVLISGHSLLARTASDDKFLVPALLNVLEEIDHGFSGKITYGDFRDKRPDAVIATGSNNTARYFEYYFAKFPHIIRKNRNSVAVVTGKETEEQLEKLADDVFIYFGLGCRNVSKIFVPENYDLDHLFRAFYNYKWVVNNNKYGNNYDYHRTLYMLNKDEIIENGFLLVKEDLGLSSPMAALFIERYKAPEQVKERLRQDAANIQAVVSEMEGIKNAVPFGKAQSPGLMDYPDKVDVMDFLQKL